LQPDKGAVIATAVADGNGNIPSWDQVLLIPYGTSGALSYRVAGQSSGTTATFGFSVGGFDPLLNPSTWYIAPGHSMQGNGTGFAPGEKISIGVNGAGVSQATADTDGNFVVTIKAPNTNKPFTFSAAGTQSGGSATVTIGVNAECYIDPNAA
jgi:hypothetical protein